MICTKCNGEGLVLNLICEQCTGTGKIMETEETVVAPVVEEEVKETFTEDSGENCEAPAVAEEIAE